MTDTPAAPAKDEIREALTRAAYRGSVISTGLNSGTQDERDLVTLARHVAALTAQLEAERATGDETARHVSRLLDHLARETARADAAEKEAKALREVETGWLIERGDSEVCAPLYWGGVHGWTTDNLKAIRYARREDAQAEADWSESEATYKARIAEHQWVPARATLAQPAADGGKV